MGSQTVGKYLAKLEFQIMHTENGAFIFKRLRESQAPKMVDLRIGMLSPLMRLKRLCTYIFDRNYQTI